MGVGGRQSAEAREEVLSRLRKVLWRDFAFLVLGGIALKIINYVESHASDADLRGGGEESSSDGRATGIVDAGFVLTAPLYRFLSARRGWNDALALLNSLLLVAPNAYLAKVTLWDGDYSLSFRLLAAQLFRSFCGWFTYLPPDPHFLMSYYDFPEVLQCLSRDCSSAAAHSTDEAGGGVGGSGEGGEEQVLPFVSFFSGHVATVVMAANHMYLAGHVRWAVVMHALNALQIVRLLATRGHYSIDIIIGWCVAVYVSNPAERLGRYYSRGVTLKQLVVPGNARDAFERLAGLHDVRLGGGGGGGTPAVSREESGVSGDGGEDGAGGRYRYYYDIDGASGATTSDTAARILAETATDFAARSLADLRAELSSFGLRMHDLVELRRSEMLRLLDLAQLRMAELRAEARWFVGPGEGADDGGGSEYARRRLEGMTREEVLQLIMERTRRVADRTARIAAGMAPEFARRSLAELRSEVVERAGLRMRQVQEIVRELRRNDLLRLLALAQLKVEELRAEARLLGVTLTDGMGHREILVKIMMRMRDVVLDRLGSKDIDPNSGEDIPTPPVQNQRAVPAEKGEVNVEVSRADNQEGVTFAKDKNA